MQGLFLETTIIIASGELTEDLLKKIKQLFDGKAVTIPISTELDDTGYLLASEANKKHLLESMVGEPAVYFTHDKYTKRVSELLGRGGQIQNIDLFISLMNLLSR